MPQREHDMPGDKPGWIPSQRCHRVVAGLCASHAGPVTRASYSDDMNDRLVTARRIAKAWLRDRGIKVDVTTPPPSEARVFAIPQTTLAAVFTTVAAVPALVDASTLPWTWRLAVRLAGLPVADRPVPALLAAGVSVAVLERSVRVHWEREPALRSGVRVQPQLHSR